MLGRTPESLAAARQPRGVAVAARRPCAYAGVLLALAVAIVGISGTLPAQRASAAARPSPSDSAQVAATLTALFAAAERGDLAALDTLYAGDSATIVEGAGISRGWADYRDNHLKPELQSLTISRYRPADIEVRVAGDLAWAIFRYTLAGTAEGKPVDIVGRGTAILERRGPKWVVQHTQTSGRARRPTDPPGE